MTLIHIVAALAIVQYFYFGFMVGRARQRYGVKAPATSGHEQFDRAYRVQMNTLEQLVGFLPALILASFYVPAGVAAGLGLVYLVGRFIYRQQYLSNPSRRGPGFLLTIAPTTALLVCVFVGAARQWLA